MRRVGPYSYSPRGTSAGLTARPRPIRLVCVGTNLGRSIRARSQSSRWPFQE